MNSLKDTLGKQNGKEEQPQKHGKPNKSKNKWALEDEDKQYVQEEDKIQSGIQQYILTAYHNNSNFSEMAFYEISEQTQSNFPSQIQALTALQTQVNVMSHNANERLQIYLEGLLECLIRRIKKLRRKQNKQNLQEYDKIVQTNFKRKGVAYIDEDSPRQAFKNREMILGKNICERDGSSNKNGSNSGSSDGRLNLLLSKSNANKVKDEKKEPEVNRQEESVSFSSMLFHQNKTVRQRKREPPKKEKPPQHQKKKEDEDEGNNDQGFMFYRPKANKRKG